MYLMSLGEDRFHDGDDVGGVSETVESKYAFQLLKNDDGGGSGHETHDGCMGQKIHDESQPENAEGGFEEPGEECGREGQVEVQRWILRRVHLAPQHWRRQQRRHRHRPHR